MPVTIASLWPWLRGLQRRVRSGERLAIQCGCNGVADDTYCHCMVICAHVEQQLLIEDDVERGPPPDPVVEAPVEAYGLNLEPAKPSKWHLAGAAVWIGTGLSATLLVTWVPQPKAAALLVTMYLVLEGRCPVALYRSWVGALQDAIQAIGGGWYLMKGLHEPLKEHNELGQGPGTFVRVRPQMLARITHLQSVLTNKPGASMLAAVGPALLAEDAIVWEIGGDAARERLQCEGLGAFWYDIWWGVPSPISPASRSCTSRASNLSKWGSASS